MLTIQAVKLLEKQVQDPGRGLPQEIFFFVSRLTPLVNVDLLIRDEQGRTLLAWRDDQFSGKGWHLPGGIIRFKEKIKTRILKVAKEEIGIPVKFKPEPIAIHQIICDHHTRGHFISLLFECYLPGRFILRNQGLRKDDPGYLKWHQSAPKNLIKVHRIYRKYLAQRKTHNKNFKVLSGGCK